MCYKLKIEIACNRTSCWCFELKPSINYQSLFTFKLYTEHILIYFSSTDWLVKYCMLILRAFLNLIIALSWNSFSMFTLMKDSSTIRQWFVLTLFESNWQTCHVGAKKCRSLEYLLFENPHILLAIGSYFLDNCFQFFK